MTLPVVHTMLDRGGRVTILIRGQNDAAAHLLPLIPIPVEVRIIPEEAWLTQLAEAVRWADQLCVALPNQDYAPLANQIRTLRFQLDNNFAHVLITSDILCGVGACLACVTPTRDGNLTRTCIHGPVFPLAAIA
jgi:dihydroorotate dehydrogenase electron transfer subunit